MLNITPVRQGSVLEDRHLLDLLEHILVEPRGQGVLAPVVSDVEVDGLLLLAQVGRRGLDVPHEDSVVEIGHTQSSWLELDQLLNVLDEALDHGQADAERGLVEELAFHLWVPGAGREPPVLKAVEAGPG